MFLTLNFIALLAPLTPHRVCSPIPPKTPDPLTPERRGSPQISTPESWGQWTPNTISHLRDQLQPERFPTPERDSEQFTLPAYPSATKRRFESPPDTPSKRQNIFESTPERDNAFHTDIDLSACFPPFLPCPEFSTRSTTPNRRSDILPYTPQNPLDTTPERDNTHSDFDFSTVPPPAFLISPQFYVSNQIQNRDAVRHLFWEAKKHVESAKEFYFMKMKSLQPHGEIPTHVLKNIAGLVEKKYQALQTFKYKIIAHRLYLKGYNDYWKTLSPEFQILCSIDEQIKNDFAKECNDIELKINVVDSVLLRLPTEPPISMLLQRAKEFHFMKINDLHTSDDLAEDVDTKYEALKSFNESIFKLSQFEILCWNERAGYIADPIERKSRSIQYETTIENFENELNLFTGFDEWMRQKE